MKSVVEEPRRRPSPYGPWVLQDPKEVLGEGAEPVLRLFCIPQAGMGAWAFHGWQEHLGPEIEVMPIELPGRNSRLGERRHTCMRRLVNALVDSLINEFRRMPFCILGHSLGAWIAYEVVHELHRRHEPVPLKLYVSANRAPQLSARENDVDPVHLHKLEYTPFWQAFFRRYGKNKDLESEGIRRYMHPMLVDDFTLLETYEPDASRETLPIPIDAFGAKDDTRYTAKQLAAWKSHTTVRFSERWFDGSHRYIVDEPEAVKEYIARDIFGCLAV